MLFFGKRCSACNGTGVKDVQAYLHQETWGVFSSEFVMYPVALSLLGVWVFFFQPSFDLILKYSVPIVAGTVVLMLFCEWCVLPRFRFRWYGRCATCGGSGRKNS